MRNHGDQNLIVGAGFLLTAKDVVQTGNVSKARKPGDSIVRLDVREAAEHADFTISHPDVRLIDLLADDGLINACNLLLLQHVGEFDFDVHADVLTTIDVRGELDLRSDVDLLELRCGIRLRTSGDYRTERSGDVGNRTAYHEHGFTAIGRADLRTLQNSGGRVAQQGLDDGAGEAGGEVGTGELTGLRNGDQA